MRNSWIVGVLLVWIASCGGGKPGAQGSSNGGSASGKDLYARMGCGTCHGVDGAGAQFGPPLHGKKQFWTRENLVTYLKDPIAYAAKDPRLSAQSKKFMLPMQRFDMLKPDELAALADHVFAMP